MTPASVVLSSLRLVGSQGGGGTQYELRLYETTGNAADVSVRLGVPASRARATNFLGEPVDAPDKIDLADSELRFRILPWKIVTLRLKR